ncbi:hypothetical protein PsorP6_011319 [Peronosclerospora sorghi]|uniref:Uncharacterized protein n=1 Tax=Peronosclerospora sorghi TaxID=230839 RepID=A0ACC0WL71_9STRA|nr:hypothetical protein PsorP6_011319 [Peronosclerospora sorghi]
MGTGPSRLGGTRCFLRYTVQYHMNAPPARNAHTISSNVVSMFAFMLSPNDRAIHTKCKCSGDKTLSEAKLIKVAVSTKKKMRYIELMPSAGDDSCTLKFLPSMKQNRFSSSCSFRWTKRLHSYWVSNEGHRNFASVIRASDFANDFSASVKVVDNVAGGTPKSFCTTWCLRSTSARSKAMGTYAVHERDERLCLVQS